jgi:3-methyladenine DNA glycosylase Tag
MITGYAVDEDITTVFGKTMSRFFPDFERASDQFDSQIAKAAADPWANKFQQVNVIRKKEKGLSVRNKAHMEGSST